MHLISCREAREESWPPAWSACVQHHRRQRRHLDEDRGCVIRSNAHLIADSIETVMHPVVRRQHQHSGCDKNMPGCLIAMARVNRPALMITAERLNRGARPRRDMPREAARHVSVQCYGEFVSNPLMKPRGKDSKACPGAGAAAECTQPTRWLRPSRRRNGAPYSG